MDARPKQTGKLIRENISETDAGAEVILYGSRARGDYHDESDWDILVLTDYPVTIEKENTLRDHLYKLELKLGEVLSLFIFSKQDWNTLQKSSPYYYSVLKEGILL